jgi:hypothetical protein
MTVFYIELATSDLGYSKRDFLLMQLFCFFAFYSSFCSMQIVDRRKMLIYATTAIALFGFVFSFS